MTPIAWVSRATATPTPSLATMETQVTICGKRGCANTGGADGTRLLQRRGAVASKEIGNAISSGVDVDMNMPDPIEQLGLHAHERGIPWAENPYVKFAGPTIGTAATAEAALTLAAAWWRGWDRAALAISYQTGRMNDTTSLPVVPIIDVRSYVDADYANGTADVHDS